MPILQENFQFFLAPQALKSFPYRIANDVDQEQGRQRGGGQGLLKRNLEVCSVSRPTDPQGQAGGQTPADDVVIAEAQGAGIVANDTPPCAEQLMQER